MFSENFTKRVYKELSELLVAKNICPDKDIYSYHLHTYNLKNYTEIYSGSFDTKFFNLDPKENFHELCNLLYFNLYTEKIFGLVENSPKLVVHVRTLDIGHGCKLLINVYASKKDEVDETKIWNRKRLCSKH